MNNKPFFKEDPILKWSKVLCPVCSEPTGPCSKCYENPPKEIPIHKRKLISKTDGIMPIYQKNCAFRRANLWEASINYPFSQPLLKILSKIQGIDNISPTNRIYGFQIAISDLFDEREVKSRISAAYRSFIKEIQVSERNLLGENTDNISIENKYKGIVLPNGTEWIPKLEELDGFSIAIEKLLDELPGSQGIFSQKF